MIMGLPLVAGFVGQAASQGSRHAGRDVDLLVATIFAVFVLATLKSIPDVTQVAQLGRYYLPVFVLAMPTAVAGVIDWLDGSQINRRAIGLAGRDVRRPGLGRPDLGLRRLVAGQALSAPLAGPARGRRLDQEPSRQRSAGRPVMTWFPWELRIASDRTTILLPRNYSARRIEEVIRQYRVTHVLWGSFEPPPARRSRNRGDPISSRSARRLD